jgi:hypothetical protein
MRGMKDELKDYINWAVGITLFVSALLFSKEKLLALLSTNILQAALSTALLTTTVVWFFLYLKAVRHELELLDTSFDAEQIRKLSGYVLPTAIGLAIFFGCLIALSDNILWYSGLAALLSSFDLYGQAMTIRNVNILITEKKFKGNVGEKQADILFSYYVKKPLLSRNSIVLVSFCFSFVLASYSIFLDNAYLNYAAYASIIIVIIASEIVLQKWRQERDTALFSLQTKGLNEPRSHITKPAPRKRTAKRTTSPRKPRVKKTETNTVPKEKKARKKPRKQTSAKRAE